MGKGKTSKALKKLAGMNDQALQSLQRQAGRKISRPAPTSTGKPNVPVTEKQVEQLLKNKHFSEVAEKLMSSGVSGKFEAAATMMAPTMPKLTIPEPAPEEKPL